MKLILNDILEIPITGAREIVDNQHKSELLCFHTILSELDPLNDDKKVRELFNTLNTYSKENSIKNLKILSDEDMVLLNTNVFTHFEEHKRFFSNHYAEIQLAFK